MDQAKQIALLKTSLALTQEKRRPLTTDETLVPVAHYTDARRFERERRLAFHRALNFVTLATKVASPGDFVTADVVGTPIVVVRGDDGRLRAFLNVCRHRGATVELRPEGQCKRFVCPYHAWTYNRDGSLHKVRHADGFPTLRTEQHGLVELMCEEFAGLVFVCPDPSVNRDDVTRPPATFVTELEGLLGPELTVYASTSRTWQANWKLIVEGGIESYHFRIAHKETIAPYFGDTNSTYERMGHHLRLVLPKLSITELDGLPPEQWDIRDHTHVIYTLHPNAMVLLQKSHFDLIVLSPLTVDTTRIDVMTVGRAAADSSPEGQRYFEKNHAISVKTLDEDFAIAEQIQRGIDTAANEHFRFARFEGALTEWHQQLDRLLHAPA